MIINIYYIVYIIVIVLIYYLYALFHDIKILLINFLIYLGLTSNLIRKAIR